MALDLLHLSSVIRRPLVDRDGERIGRIQDVVARLGGSAHPPVVGVVVRIEGRDLFVPIRKIASFERGRARLRRAAGRPAAASSAAPARCSCPTTCSRGTSSTSCAVD